MRRTSRGERASELDPRISDSALDKGLSPRRLCQVLIPKTDC